MEIQPTIQYLVSKKLIGLRTETSLVNNKTGQLWQSFMPRRKEIIKRVNKDFISMQIYDPTYFDDFNPAKTFEKWATVEVTDFNNIPPEMETYILEAGNYAVFNYKGSSTDNSIFEYIFSTWLPNSDYSLDDRPHFEILGEKYKNADLNSEEEIWIPIKKR